MKTNYFRKTLAGIALAGAITTASPIFAQESNSPTGNEINYCEIASTDYNCKNSCVDECLFENSRSFEQLIIDVISDRKIDLNESASVIHAYFEVEKEITKTKTAIRSLVSNGREMDKNLSELYTKRENINEAKSKEVPEIDFNTMTNFLNNQRENLKEKVLAYYPQLTDSTRGNIVYNADSALSATSNEELKNIVRETTNFFESYGIESLTAEFSNPTTARELLGFYNFLERLSNNKLEDTLKNIQLDKNKIMNDEEKDTEERILNLEKAKTNNELELTETREGFDDKNWLCIDNFKVYSTIPKVREDIAKIKDLNKFFGVSIATYVGLSQGDNNFFKNDFLKWQSENISGLEKCLSESYNLKNLNFEKLNSPQKTKINGLLNFFLGIIFPVVRNLGITYYLTKGKPKGSRIFGSLLSGGANGLFGSLFFDGLNPWVYPVRMLVTPIIIQPILKATKFYEDCDGENPLVPDD